MTDWLTAEWEDASVWRNDTQILVAERGRLQRLEQRVADKHSDRATETTAESQSAADTPYTGGSLCSVFVYVRLNLQVKMKINSEL